MKYASSNVLLSSSIVLESLSTTAQELYAFQHFVRPSDAEYDRVKDICIFLFSFNSIM